MSTHYDSLSVTEDAPDEVIKAAYRALSLKHHPDKAGNKPQSRWKMQRINDAYAVLSDPQKRADYDAQLRRERSPGVSAPPVPTRIEAQPRRHRSRRRSGASLSQHALLGWLSDARLVFPMIALIWLVIYWMVTQR